MASGVYLESSLGIGEVLLRKVLRHRQGVRPG